uniref:Uncharacterized protein n=1 Tax=Pararge aegeria TaxID=116150 RepID=S4P188_9NEOP
MKCLIANSSQCPNSIEVFDLQFLVRARSLEIDGDSTPCLREHVKLTVLRRIRLVRSAVPLNYERVHQRLRIHLCTIISSAHNIRHHAWRQMKR